MVEETHTNSKTSSGCISTPLSIILFLLIGFGLSYWGWTILQNARASSQWPTVNGVVTKSEITHDTDADGGDSYSPKIRYAYTVNNFSLENGTIKFGENSYSSRKKAETIASNYPVGKNVVVYYDPEKPDKSVLEPGVSGGSYIVLGIGVFFILISLATIPLSFLIRNRG